MNNPQILSKALEIPLNITGIFSIAKLKFLSRVMFFCYSMFCIDAAYGQEITDASAQPNYTAEKPASTYQGE